MTLPLLMIFTVLGVAALFAAAFTLYAAVAILPARSRAHAMSLWPVAPGFAQLGVNLLAEAAGTSLGVEAYLLAHALLIAGPIGIGCTVLFNQGSD